MLYRADNIIDVGAGVDLERARLTHVAGQEENTRGRVHPHTVIQVISGVKLDLDVPVVCDAVGGQCISSNRAH